MVLQIIMLLIALGYGFQESEPVLTDTPTPSTLVSLFADDSCELPCWFGLTVGESTIEDVIIMFQMQNGLFGFDPVEIREEQRVEFNWAPINWHRQQTMLSNLLYIQDDTLTGIEVVMNEDITLKHTLDVLGQPTTITIGGGLDNHLDLFYTEDNIIVIVSLSASKTTCEMNSFIEDFEVDFVAYYTPEVLEIYAEWYTSSGIGIVSKSAWDSWQSLSDNRPCHSAMNRSAIEKSFTVSDLTPVPPHSTQVPNSINR